MAQELNEQMLDGLLADVVVRVPGFFDHREVEGLSGDGIAVFTPDGIVVRQTDDVPVVTYDNFLKLATRYRNRKRR